MYKFYEDIPNGAARPKNVDPAEFVVQNYNRLAPENPAQVARGAALAFDDFTGGKIHDRASSAAGMVSVSDLLNDRNADSARDAIFPLVFDQTPLGTHTEYRYGQYLVSIALDVVPLNDHVSRETDLLKEALEPNPDMAEVIAALDADKGHSPDKKVWLTEVPYNIMRLGSLASDISIESALIKSSQLVDGLRDPEAMAKMSPTEQLRAIVAAEAVYQPLSEITTFDALAATLLGRTYQLRFRNAGRGDLLSRAQDILDRAGSPEEIEMTLPRLIKYVGGDFASEPFINDGVVNHDVLWHEGTVSPEGSNDDHRIVIRLKDAGGVARKLYHYENGNYALDDQTPQDILGATIIVPDNRSVGQVLGKIHKRILANPGITDLAPAPGRKQSVHIKGPNDFRDEVLMVGKAGIDPKNIDFKEHNGEFQVAKLTFLYSYTDSTGMDRQIPVEIQCMTEESRKSLRTGEDSHPHFKSTKYKSSIQPVYTKDQIRQNLQTQVEIYRRRLDLDHGRFSIRRTSKSRLDAEIQMYSQQNPEFANRLGSSAYIWT